MKRIISVLAALSAAFGLYAQTAIQVQVPQVVAVGEQFSLAFVVEGEKPSDFSWTPSSDISVLWGPQSGSSTSISIINGKKSVNSQTTYTYVLCQDMDGQITIPAASAKVKGKEIHSNPVTVKVIAGGSSQPSAGQQRQSSPAAGSASSEDLFMKLSLDRRNVVVGEPINATLKLYARNVDISGFEDVKFPSFNGFWSQEDAPKNVEFQREALGDQIYNSAVLRTYKLIPQQSGDLEIDPAYLVCLVNVIDRTASGSIFDSFFSSGYKTVRKRVSTHAETIHVRPLPEPRPAGFCGGVGKFSVSMKASKDSLQTHEASSIVVKVTGTGNLALVEAPKINFPPDFEVYDVKTTTEANARIFEYPFIPRAHGEFTVPALEFSYYDVKSGTYRTASANPVTIRVSRSAVQESVGGGASFVGVAGRDVRDIGTDIRYIRTGAQRFRKSGSFFVTSPAFIALAALLVLAAAAAYFAIKKMRALRGDVARTRRKSASKMALKRLHQAGVYLKENLHSAFYEELHRALLGFAGDRLGLDSSDQDKDTISASLLAHGASGEDAEAFIALLDACEFARYSPDAGHDAMQAHYDSALNVISSLDDNMSSHKKSSAAVKAVAALLVMGASGVFGARNLLAQDRDSLWTAGVDAYASGDYELALSVWNDVASTGCESADLWYNMGCACFKLSDLAHSVLYFERALKTDPSHKDAGANLVYVKTFLQDRIETVPEFFVKTWARNVRSSMSSDGWAVLFLVLFAVALAAFLLFGLSRRAVLKKTGFFGGIAVAIIAAGCLIASFGARNDASSENQAIIVAPVCVTRSTPSSDTGTDLFVLHEGAKVTIVDKVGSWVNVELSDGRQGWTDEKDLEKI